MLDAPPPGVDAPLHVQHGGCRPARPVGSLHDLACLVVHADADGEQPPHQAGHAHLAGQRPQVIGREPPRRTGFVEHPQGSEPLQCAEELLGVPRRVGFGAQPGRGILSDGLAGLWVPRRRRLGSPGGDQRRLQVLQRVAGPQGDAQEGLAALAVHPCAEDAVEARVGHLHAEPHRVPAFGLGPLGDSGHGGQRRGRGAVGVDHLRSARPIRVQLAAVGRGHSARRQARRQHLDPRGA